MLILAALAALSGGYQGIHPGMTAAEAGKHGQCFSPMIDRLICRFKDGPSAVMLMTPKRRVWLVRVVLTGDENAIEGLIVKHGFTPGPGQNFARLAPDEVTFDVSDVGVLEADAPDVSRQ